MKAMSDKRRARLAAEGVTYPHSTLLPKSAKAAPLSAGLPPELQRKPARKVARPTGPDKLTVEVVIHRDRGQCAWCGGRITGERSIDWSVGHRRPRRMGGDPRPDTNSPANLILLHGDGVSGCHGALESQRAVAYDRGMLLHDTDTPSRRPVEHAVHGWVYLSDDGEAVTEPPVMSA